MKRVPDLNFVFAGDCMLGRLVNERLEREKPSYPWGDTLPLFEKAAVRVCNLECVISDRGEPQYPKEFHFRSDPKNISVLEAARIDIVSLANNHVLDYGKRALVHMLRLLDERGIKHAGAGANTEEASRPAVIKVRNRAVGFLAFTDNEPHWEADETRPGVFYVPVDPDDVRARRLFELVKGLNSLVDVVVVSAHWGPNWGYVPPPEHPPFARALIDAGADVVFGHSGHVVRGVEIYKGRPIMYCAGDFIDDYAVDVVERNDQSFVFCVAFKGRSPERLRLYPSLIRDFQARIATGGTAADIASKMTSLCEPFRASARWHARRGWLEIGCGKDQNND